MENMFSQYMSLEHIVQDPNSVSDEVILETVRSSPDVNRLYMTLEPYYELQNIFNACAFVKPYLLEKLSDLGCKPHISTRNSRNPIIEALFREDIVSAYMLYTFGFFIFYDTGESLFKVDDERFCINGHFIDIIDALYKYHKFKSIEFIRDISTENVLLKRDTSEEHIFYISKLGHISRDFYGKWLLHV